LTSLDIRSVPVYDQFRLLKKRGMRMIRVAVMFAVLGLLWSSSAPARTLVLDGALSSTFHIKDQAVLGMPGGAGGQALINQFNYHLVPPPSVATKTSKQSVLNFRYTATPPPSSVQEKTDPYGNRFLALTWQNPSGEVKIVSEYDVKASVEFAPVASTAPYPLPASSIPADAAPYLKPSEQAQSEDKEIQALAGQLVKGAETEGAAVTQILHWVVDHLHYQLDPAGYDALTTKREGKGNCQNYSHLAIALLRAAGIPARMVRGRTLEKPWEVDEDNGRRRWTSRWAAGRHAWLEIYYPDLGWLMYDSQAYHLFVSTRFIRMEVGPDNKAVHTDGLLTWRSRSGAEPKILDMRLEAEFTQDQDVVKAQKVEQVPQKLLYAASLATPVSRPAPPVVPPPAPKVTPPAPPAPRPALRLEELDFPVAFGNLEFPREIRLFEPVKAEGAGQFSLEQNYMVETAEYVTGDMLYAQALEPERPVLVTDFSLALHRFGGESGTLWVELYEDGGDGPGKLVAKSRPVPAVSIRTPANRYDWVVFSFEGMKTVMQARRYWIVLKHQSDAIVNWFYLYGKVVSPEDGTRARPLAVSGPVWNQILNIEFNFRLRGLISLKD
jgi:transglutaminase-like putative cysteine protease